jgi:hypothetical protein
MNSNTYRSQGDDTCEEGIKRRAIGRCGDREFQPIRTMPFQTFWQNMQTV